jgi:hypothetical protein
LAYLFFVLPLASYFLCLPKESNKEKALCPMLLPAKPAPTSLGKEASAPSQPLVIEMNFALFVTSFVAVFRKVMR